MCDGTQLRSHLLGNGGSKIMSLRSAWVNDPDCIKTTQHCRPFCNVLLLSDWPSYLSNMYHCVCIHFYPRSWLFPWVRFLGRDLLCQRNFCGTRVCVYMTIFNKCGLFLKTTCLPAHYHFCLPWPVFMNGGEGQAVWTRLSISPLTIGTLFSLGMYSCIPKTSFLLKPVGTWLLCTAGSGD